MHQPERKLDSNNVDRILQEFMGSLGTLGESIAGKVGLPLLESLKRDKLKDGPYAGVTLFEAANRIMSDLVILHGVSWLLRHRRFPFDKYIVEFGNEDKNGFDIRATNDTGNTLVGEAFNVAPSFFPVKKSSAVRKLGERGSEANYRVVLVNHDAFTEEYIPRDANGPKHILVHYVIVNIGDGVARTVAHKATFDPLKPRRIRKGTLASSG